MRLGGGEVAAPSRDLAEQRLGLGALRRVAARGAQQESPRRRRARRRRCAAGAAASSAAKAALFSATPHLRAPSTGSAATAWARRPRRIGVAPLPQPHQPEPAERVSVGRVARGQALELGGGLGEPALGQRCEAALRPAAWPGTRAAGPAGPRSAARSGQARVAGRRLAQPLEVALRRREVPASRAPPRRQRLRVGGWREDPSRAAASGGCSGRQCPPGPAAPAPPGPGQGGRPRCKHRGRQRPWLFPLRGPAHVRVLSRMAARRRRAQ